MILYHVTTKPQAASIRRKGFKPRRRFLGRDDVGAPFYVTGVWFSDRPWCDGGNCDVEDLPRGYTVLRLKIDGRNVRKFEVINDGFPYREWCISAELATHRLLPD